MMTLTETKTVRKGTIETQASIFDVGCGFYKVVVIHRFDSGNFCTEKPHENLSLVSAKGLLHFYTS